MAIKPAGLVFIWIFLSFRSHGIRMEEITSVAQLDRNESVLIFDIHGKLNELEKTVLSSHKKLLETQTNLTNCLNGNPQLNGLLEKLHKLEVGLKEMRTNTKKPGDIVIQRRIDGSEDFFRPWADYKKGFGNSSGEFFIGLDKLNKLTNSRPYELLILMADWENESRFARYDQFIIGNEAEKYVLKELGKYSGSAGDALGYSLGQKFTTKDEDNDVWNKNCAVEFTGAWWYKNCHISNLNGRYIKGGTTTAFAQGVDWDPWKGQYYSLKFVEMILRPT